MAAPSDITIENLSGRWTLDKARSTDPGPLLKLQGVNWMLRKAVGLASVTVHISRSIAHSSAPSEKDIPPVQQLDLLQIPTGGLTQTRETRVLRWEHPTILSDFLFGSRTSRSRLIYGREGHQAGSDQIVPDLVLETKLADEHIGKYLRGEISLDFSDEEQGFLVEGGEGKGLWIHTCDEREDGKWANEQVWGFEMVDGERRHTRRFVLVNAAGEYQLGRLVFSHFGP